MTDNGNTQVAHPPTPNPDMKRLERLVGSWRISGGAQGTVTYEWMEGGFFLIQHVELQQDGMTHQGLEIIGHERSFDGEPSADIKSRYYDNMGNTFDYVYEMEGDTLTIWAGGKGSPYYYRGTFSEDGNSASGRWVYPDGGGYDSNMSRVK
jgi:hypothetical protein